LYSEKTGPRNKRTLDRVENIPLYNHMVINNDTDLDLTFHALADSTRRSMLAMLAGGQARTAGELGAPFKMSQPATSKHLKVMEKAGLVTRHKEGRQHCFIVNTDRLDAARDWIDRHAAFWSDTMARLEDLVDELETAGEEDNDSSC